jgi:Holliday junction DNA helicase RuvA
MIAYLKGKIIINKTGLAIVEAGGVGYRLNTKSDSVLRAGESAEFFIHEHIREDADDLYGFKTFEELELFEKLISVNGVGPKAGMAIMTSGSVESIISAIADENLAFFKSISGIGNKAATKIILDLKTKVSGIREINVLTNSSDADDLVAALTSLGYKNIEISKITAKIPVELKKIEDKITWCLKNLSE